MRYQLTTYIYLHGFASSPQSSKAEYLRDRFAASEIDLNIPDLNQGDFSHLTITRQIKQVAALFPQPPRNSEASGGLAPPRISEGSGGLAPPLSKEGYGGVTLIGSSLGGLTAALLAQKYPQVKRLVLLAPAFGFLSHWLPKLGEEQLQRWQTEKYLLVHHYGEKRSLPLHYQFIVDAAQYNDEKIQCSIPTLILHGRHDEVIPIQASRDFAQYNPGVQLIELDSDHALGNVMAEIWHSIQIFCHLA